ncbi:hypothetical protein INR49_008634 [Caranx melampygus]|nr:hypothetical protein INR49_008634 [Caranx melampygus]
MGRTPLFLFFLSLSLSLCLSSAHSPPLQLGGASQPPTPSSVSACSPSRIWPQFAFSADLTHGVSTEICCEISTKV